MVQLDVRPAGPKPSPSAAARQDQSNQSISVANISGLELKQARQSKKIVRPRNSFVNFMNQASARSMNNQSESQISVLCSKLCEMDKVFKLQETQRMKIQNMREISKIFDAISDFKNSLEDKKDQTDKINNKIVLKGLFTHGKLQQLFN